MKVYTDGSCLGNGDKSPGSRSGGWACVHETFKICGGETDTTNNRMELTAVIRALEKNPNVTIVTDSKYVKDGIETWIHGWKQRDWKTSSGGDVKNQDLWKKLDKLVTFATQWEWVKAHNGDRLNECADSLARKCAILINETSTTSNSSGC